MKRFNLKEYLKNPNKKIVTGDGRKVTRVLCTDAKGLFPVAVLVERFDGLGENTLSYTSDGSRYAVGIHPSDLYFATEKHEGWINLYKNEDGISWISPNYFTSQKEAEKEGKTHTCSVTTIKIEWEE